MALHRLSRLKVKTARPGLLCDGAGLYLHVSLNPKTGELRKSWVYRLIHGMGECELLVMFQGPHGYISPGWYGGAQAVPTWNYTAVHLAGIPEVLSAEENLAVLDRLVERFESRMPDPKLMWERPNDEAFVNRMAAGTVGFRLTPTRVVAKRKLSQNKPDETIETVISELSSDGPYANAALAREMRRAQDARTGAHR